MRGHQVDGVNLALIDVYAPGWDGVYLRLLWDDAAQVLPIGLADGMASIQLPMADILPDVEAFPTAELRPEQIGCRSG